eukprot:3409574-Pyramimonas_sp.AAC.1
MCIRDSHKEDLPHIKFCGKVVVRQNDHRRFYLREKQLGLRWIRNHHGLLRWSRARALAR